MRLPKISGLIRRRLLVNFRANPEVVAKQLPSSFRPKLHNGHAIVGICLIRLEQIRPTGFPPLFGLSSENAAHRIAVLWDEKDGHVHEGVFIPRRDSASLLSQWAGGRIFPGEHHAASFDVSDREGRIKMSIISRDGKMCVNLDAQESDSLPATSCFGSVAESSAFFEGGSIGYSVTSDCCRLDGIRLKTDDWQVRPLAVSHIESTFFSDPRLFPVGSVIFDHALIMRNISHQWLAVDDLTTHHRSH